MSQLFSTTLRTVSTKTDTASHEFLLRAGYIRQLATGIFTYMPLAQRSLTKIENIIRQEIDAIGGQEITMPVVHPGELWQETERYYEVDETLTRFKDRNGRDMVLGMTHEEVIADLVRQEINSYKQLPALLYQIQTKWRDERRSRAGLIRVREFTMKDSYSLDRNTEGLDKQYDAHYHAYFRIYARCGLPVIAVESDTGMMGGKQAHEYMYITPSGEDWLLVSEDGEYMANREVARFQKPLNAPEEPQPLEKVATPDCKTIGELAQFLDIPESKTAKAVFMIATITENQEDVERFVFAVVRGDMELNETRLLNTVKAKALRSATEAEIRAIGAEPGYGSPLGVKNCLIVVDDIIPESPNLVAGANEAGYHMLNVNVGRDYRAHIVTDLAAAQEGDLAPNGSPLTVTRGVEVGNIFKLGTRYTESLGAVYQDEHGKTHPVVMGSYGIGVGRLLACVAEEHHDDNGLILPISVAPFSVHLISLGKSDEPHTVASELYDKLRSSGIEVLYDDREERPGVKFNDADLIGCPVRVTVGERGLKDGVIEIKLRREADKRTLPLENAVDQIESLIADLYAELAS